MRKARRLDPEIVNAVLWMRQNNRTQAEVVRVVSLSTGRSQASIKRMLLQIPTDRVHPRPSKVPQLVQELIAQRLDQGDAPKHIADDLYLPRSVVYAVGSRLRKDKETQT